MVTVFDAAQVRFDATLFLFPVVALLVAAYIITRTRARGRRWILAGVIGLLALLFVALPIADHYHVRAALTDGSARRVEGIVSQHKRQTVRRWAGRSTGVGISSSNRYTTSTSEQFFVGQQWFWLRVNGFPSGTSFTNGGDPPLALQNGTRARVTWFADPWFDDETRILRLEIERPSTVKGDSGTPPLPEDFARFWQQFSQAAARGDRDGVKTFTRFPFLFSGSSLDEERFDSIWAGIFPAPLRPCFTTATPVQDGAAWSVSCGVYVYIFEKGTDGWRLASFTADPEAAE